MKIGSILRCLLDWTSRRSICFVNKCHLEKLPTEILLRIADFHSPHCVTFLTPSSKLLLYKFGNDNLRNFSKVEKLKFNFKFGLDPYLRYDSAIRHKQAGFRNFLILLAEDLPDQVFCQFCQTIHSPNQPDMVRSKRQGDFVKCYFLEYPRKHQAKPVKFTPGSIRDTFENATSSYRQDS